MMKHSARKSLAFLLALLMLVSCAGVGAFAEGATATDAPAEENFPGSPEIPEAPGTSEIPDEPAEDEAPGVTETPLDPETPDEAEEDEAPGVTETPEEEETPDEPEEGEALELPEDPEEDPEEETDAEEELSRALSQGGFSKKFSNFNLSFTAGIAAVDPVGAGVVTTGAGDFENTVKYTAVANEGYEFLYFTYTWIDSNGTPQPGGTYTESTMNSSTSSYDIVAHFQKVENYPLWVGGKRVNDKNQNNLFSDGTVSFTPAVDTGSGVTPATLTLNGYSYSGEGYHGSIPNSSDVHAGLFYSGSDPLTVVLVGENSITQTVNQDVDFFTAVFSYGPMTFTGEGSLSAQGGSYGVLFKNRLTVDNSGDFTASGVQAGIKSSRIELNDTSLAIGENAGTVSVSSTGDDSTAVELDFGATTIDGGKVTIEGRSRGLGSSKGVTVNGGELTVSASGGSYSYMSYYGIWSNSGPVVIGENVTSVLVYGPTQAVKADLKNAVAGTGWENMDGSGDKLDIDISENARELNYKRVQFPPYHVHAFSYTASGATITATCTDGCPIATGLTLSIATPTNAVYTPGKAWPALLNTDYNTTAFPGTYSISYTRDGIALQATPTDAGDYVASVTVGEGDSAATAYGSYTIAKATPTCATPTSLSATYGDTLKDVELTNPEGNTDGAWAWVNAGTTPVGPAGTNAFGVSFTPEDTANYNGAAGLFVLIDVAKATPTCAVPEGVTATAGELLADVKLTNPAGNIEGTWTWEADDDATVGTAGEKSFLATFTPTDTDNYNSVEHVAVTVNVNALRIDFKGGGLRRRVVVGTRFVVSDETDLRLVFSCPLPEGAELVTGENGSYFTWSVGNTSLDRKLWVTSYDAEHDECAIAVTGVPKSYFDTDFSAELHLVYKYNGETLEAVSGPGTRNVYGVCRELKGRGDTWGAYARYLLGETASYSLA